MSSPNTSELSDATALALMQTTHEYNDGFQTLYLRYVKLVYGIAWYLTRDAAVAEAVTQDAFIVLFNKRATLTAENLGSWLSSTARNKVKQHLRKLRRVLRTNADLDTEPDTGHHSDPSLTLIARDTAERIDAALAQLTVIERDAFVAIVLGGTSYEDYAADVGIAVPSARARVSRARDRLIAILGPDYGPPAP